MTTNQRNILHPLTISIPEPKVVSFLTGLDNQQVNKSFEVDSMSEDSLNNIQVLRLEIEHLKRENTFLKRKIWELQLGRISPRGKGQKKQSLNGLNIVKKNAMLTAKDPKENSLGCIFVEIQNVLESLAQIHRVEISKQSWVGSSESEIKDIPSLLSQQEMGFIAQSKVMKQKMSRKLQMIALQNQQTRYGSLLQVFTEYYLHKSQQQFRIKQQTQKFIQKTLEISKQLVQSVANRTLSRSIRSSYMSSVQKTTNEPFSPCSGNKQNLSRFQLRINTERHAPWKSTIMKSVIEERLGRDEEQRRVK